MFDGLLGGKIYGQPSQRAGKNNNTFVVAKMRVPVGDGESMFASLIAFDSNACAGLLALSDGDAASVAGAVTVKVWVGHQDGQPRPAVDVVVSQVLSVYAIKKKRDKVQGDGSDTAPARPPAGRTGYGSAPRHGNAPPSGRAFEQWQAAQLPADDFADMEGDVL